MNIDMSRPKINNLIKKPSRQQNVKVYLLFKCINQDFYINISRGSHWQIVCYFKGTNKYKCYELQTNNGDKNGYIEYKISDFNYDDLIHYYYIGRCRISEEELENKCEQIMINKLKYIIGIRDCQTWATLLIKSLGLDIDANEPLPIKQMIDTFYTPDLLDDYLQTSTLDIISRPVGLVIDFDPVFKLLFSRIKTCDGYRNLQRKRNTLLRACFCANNCCS